MMEIVFFVLVGLGLLCGGYRLMNGPSAFDRILGLDTVNIILVGVLLMIAHLLNSSLYLDIALVFGVLAFMETIVLSKYVGGAK
jgi:multicomponent Na+:H+ antiporter subunit F